MSFLLVFVLTNTLFFAAKAKLLALAAGWQLVFYTRERSVLLLDR